MTEVPDHLLRRSRERRAALGLGPPAESAAPSAPPSSGETSAPAPAPVEQTPAPAPAPTTTSAPEEVVATPSYVIPTTFRRVPVWMLPVLVALPLWAVLFIAAFSDHTTKKAVDPLVLGQQVYDTAGCAGCHGATGGGGVGPALVGGDAKLTFPNIADHVAWVKTGSAGVKGKPYGDPNRPGGQRIAKLGVMPAFATTLSDQEIQAVVLYEREKL